MRQLKLHEANLQLCILWCYQPSYLLLRLVAKYHAGMCLIQLSLAYTTYPHNVQVSSAVNQQCPPAGIMHWLITPAHVLWHCSHSFLCVVSMQAAPLGPTISPRRPTCSTTIPHADWCTTRH